MNTENPIEQQDGMRMSHIFLIVLALHIIVIGGAFAFQKLRGNRMEPTVASATVDPVDPTKSEASSATAPPSVPVANANQTAEMNEDHALSSIENSEMADLAEGESIVSDTSSSQKDSKTPANSNSSMSPKATSTASASSPSNVKSDEVYVVVKGDSLVKIAKKHGMTVEQLREINQLKKDLIVIGQKLKIATPLSTVVPQVVASTPKSTGVSSAPAVANNQASQSTVASSNTGKKLVTYKVVKGDTLTRIAKKWNVSTQAIIEANSIKDPSRISIGMELVVPVETAAQSQPTPAKSGQQDPSNLAMTKS